MKMIIALSALLMTGCANTGVIGEAALTLSKNTLAGAEWTICEGSRVGAVRDSFGSPERAQVWRDLCGLDNYLNPLDYSLLRENQ